MSEPDPTNAEIARFEILRRLAVDRARGALADLATYQAGYPGHEALVAAEYAHVTNPVSGAALGGLSSEFDPSTRRIGGRFRILTDEAGRDRVLGSGGFGVVYLAEDEILHRRVALKVLSRRRAGSVTSIERLRREAAIMAQLDHPSICTTYDTGEDAATGMVYVAMKYIEGRTLADVISTAPESSTHIDLLSTASGATQAEASPGAAQRPVNTPRSRQEIFQILRVIEEVARALHVAHEHGIIHRDIKPGNIMVASDGVPVLLDFGLARDVDSDGPTLTQAGELMGTLPYMSPEQIVGGRFGIDRRVDVWALGVALYECLTRRRPFEASTEAGIIQAISTKEPPDPRRLNPELSAEVAIVLATAMEKDRDRRYATALAFAEDLRRVRSFEPILARPPGIWLRIRRFTQRSPALTAILVVVPLALVLITVLLIQTLREAAAKTAALGDYERLSDLKRSVDLVAEAEDLWPAEPEIMRRLDDWHDRAERLVARRAEHEQALAEIERAAIARPPATSNPARDTAPAAEGGGDTAVALRTSTDDRNWTFANPDLSFRHGVERAILAVLDRLTDPEPRRGALAGVRERIRVAKSVDAETVRARAGLPSWTEAIASIADPRECPAYGGRRITVQRGLIPLGRDPASGLWEFLHLATCAAGHDPAPKRDPAGHLVPQEDLGVVLVLIPGGTLEMGAVRPEDPAADDAHHVDPLADPDEAPIIHVPLRPFFISKYEVTQAQWMRLMPSNPSKITPPGVPADHPIAVVSFLHPVEGVSWDDCVKWTTRLGLTLPTEAQWEWAARGGTDKPWWTGADPAKLEGAANLADESLRLQGNTRGPLRFEPFDDGFILHAPVGSFRPNPFGLCDVHGNVSEWCADCFGSYEVASKPDDGRRTPPDCSQRVLRGGGYLSTAADARVSRRQRLSPNATDQALGFRPARPVIVEETSPLHAR